MLSVVQALLDEWRDELSRKPLGMSEADACAILQIAPDENGAVAEEDLKQVRDTDFSGANHG
jgi:DnaJ family protein C protein 13